jgi:hypothetical protein
MRVYLSKSNLACPYLVDMVRQIIQKEGYLTVEFFGDKEYTEKDLLSSDVLVVIPAKEILAKAMGGIKSIVPPSDVDWGYHLGRGQFQQVTSFMTRNKRMMNIKGMSYIACQDPTIICLEEVGETEVYCGGADSLAEFPGGDWKIRYGKLEINSYLDNLKTCLHQAARSGVRFSDYTAESGVKNVSAGMGKTFVPKSYGYAEISAMQIPADATVIKQSDGSFTIHRNGNTEEEWMKRADGRIVFPKQTKDGETYVKDCFDGTPHLACALLYNL